MKKKILIFFLGALTFASWGGGKDATKDYEINVIRPRYFVKKSKAELGVDLAVVLNQTFTYTYLLSGVLVYHFTNSIGVGIDASYGLTVNKADRKLLSDQFNIEIDIFEVEYLAGLAALWTPVYGKYQLASGRLIYFDTYASAGIGLMGIETDIEIEKGEKVDSKQYSCYAFTIGVGQRFYLSKKTSLRWQIKNHIISYDGGNQVCAPVPTDLSEDVDPEYIDTNIFHTVVSQVGISYFI